MNLRNIIYRFSIRTLFTFSIVLFSAFSTGGGKSEYNVPVAAYSVCTGDLDLDGDIDIVIGHNYSWQTYWSGVSILKNINSGDFILDDSIYIFGGQSNIYANTITNDSFPNIIGQYYNNNNKIAILEYESGNYFPSYFTMGENISAYNIGNINNDSFIDIIFISNQDKFWGVLYNDGNGNFSSPQYHYVDDYYPADIACADLNGDGRDDIVVGGKTEIFFSKENGFQSLFFNTITTYIELIDFENDGDMDIIGAHQPLPSNYYLITRIENLRNENFTVHEPYIFQPVCKGKFSMADFNNDSLPDFLFHTQDMQHLLIFYNKGNFDIGDSLFIPMADYGETTRRSACADLDGNGFNDIATIRYLYAQIPNLNILFNNGDGTFGDNPITNIQ